MSIFLKNLIDNFLGSWACNLRWLSREIKCEYFSVTFDCRQAAPTARWLAEDCGPWALQKWRIVWGRILELNRVRSHGRHFAARVSLLRNWRGTDADIFVEITPTIFDIIFHVNINFAPVDFELRIITNCQILNIHIPKFGLNCDTFWVKLGQADTDISDIPISFLRHRGGLCVAVQNGLGVL